MMERAIDLLQSFVYFGTFMYGYMLHDVQLANLEDSGCSPDMCVLSLSPAREQYAFMDWFAMLSTWGVTIHTLPYSPNSQIFTRHHTQIPCFYLNKKPQAQLPHDVSWVLCCGVGLVAFQEVQSQLEQQVQRAEVRILPGEMIQFTYP